MEITINGHKREFPQEARLGDLIEKFCSAGQRVIAEVNGEIIKNPRWGETQIREGDHIELITIVGGG